MIIARKIGKKHCVERPHVQDIHEVCRYLGLPSFIEYTKRHPRNFFDPPGRVRVLLLKEDGETLRREDIKTRYQLLIALGKMIPKLESRKKRMETEKKIIERRKQMIEKQKRDEEQKEREKQQKADAKKKKKQQKGHGSKSGRGRGKGRRGRRR